MLKADELPPTLDGFTQRDYDILRRELAAAQTESRALRRQLEKALEAVNEARRAHAKMVTTLSETMRENTTLCQERDLWRARCMRLEHGSAETAAPGAPIEIGALASQLSDDEINAIRKAMARLHHPDLGGNPERMKAWNAALDRIEKS